MRSRQPEVVPRVFALCSTLLGRGCFLFAASNGMGLFTAVRDPGVRGKLAEACQPGSSNPSSASHIRKAAKPPTAIGILLSCAKKNGVGRQEEVAQRKPLKGFPLDSFGNKRAAALLRSREFQICIAFPMGQSSTYFGSTLFLACKYPLVCKKSDDFPAEQQIWQSRPPQGIFALQKSLRGGLRWGTGPSSQRGKPPRKEISRGNLLCAESGLPSLSYPRLLSTQKYAGTLDS